MIGLIGHLYARESCPLRSANKWVIKSVRPLLINDTGKTLNGKGLFGEKWWGSWHSTQPPSSLRLYSSPRYYGSTHSLLPWEIAAICKGRGGRIKKWLPLDENESFVMQSAIWRLGEHAPLAPSLSSIYIHPRLTKQLVPSFLPESVFLAGMATVATQLAN